MNHKKSKFSLIFRIISLVLIQAFLVMDFAWAIGGEFPVTDKVSATTTLSPKISLNSQEVLDAYLYRSPNSANLNEVSENPGINNQKITEPVAGNFLRNAWKWSVKKSIVIATLMTLTMNILMPGPAAATRPEALSNVEVSVNSMELNRYIPIIKANGADYTIEQNGDQALIKIKALVPLAAKKIDNDFRAAGLKAEVGSSDANFEQSLAYANIQEYVEGIGNIHTELGLGTIEQSKLRELAELCEAITGVESGFNHWEIGKNSEIVIKQSGTGAKGITQLIRNKSVRDLARLLIEDKVGGHHLEIIAELKKMASSGRERISQAIKEGKEPVADGFSVYDNILAYKNADSDKNKTLIISVMNSKINANPKLQDVNLYYALAVWEYLQQRDNLQVGIDQKTIQSMGNIARNVNIKIAGSGDVSGFRTNSLSQANMQFRRNIFITTVLLKMIDPLKVNQVLQGEGDKNEKFSAMMSYFDQLMTSPEGNRKLGYTYLTYLWDTFRRLELRGIQGNKFALEEVSLSFPSSHPRRFSVAEAVAAAYNSGKSNVEKALLTFGNKVNANQVPLWENNIMGGSPTDSRETVNYIRKILEYRALNLGNLSEEEEHIKNKLILWRYERIDRAKDGTLSEIFEVVEKNGVKTFAPNKKRSDAFNYKRAAFLAEVFGSERVDPFIKTYGFDDWEARLLNESKILDILADILANKNSDRYAKALKVKGYLNEKQIAALAKRIENIALQKKAEAERIALAAQLSQGEKSSQTLVAVAETENKKVNPWMIRVGLAALSLTIVGAVAWIMSKRLNFDKTAVLPFMGRLVLQGLKLLGYGTILVLALTGKFFVGIVRKVFSSFSDRKPKINKPKGIYGQQQIVRRNRRVNNGVFSKIIKEIKNLFFMAIFFVIIAAPFTVPVFSHATQKQPQAPPASAADVLAIGNSINNALAISDVISFVTVIIGLGLIVGIAQWALKIIRNFRQNNLKQPSEVIVPSQAALEKLKKLDSDIRALFNRGKERVVIAFDGPSGAGKTTLANYIKAVGIAGIQPSEIQVLSRDEYLSGGDYGEGNIAILEKAWHRGKLVILEGNGIQWTSELLASDDIYAQPDIFVKITASEQLRKQRLLVKGMSELGAADRIQTASDPDSSKFSIIIEEPYDSNEEQSSLFADALATERILYNQTVKMLGRSRICDLPNRQRYIEDLVEGLKQEKLIQVAFLSIQNFKGEFNDRGAKLDEIASNVSGRNNVSIAGHSFGDWAIQAVAKALPEALATVFAGTGIKTNVYNDAKSYWVIFENVPVGFDIHSAVGDLLKNDSVFRNQVVNELQTLVKEKINANDFNKQTVEALLRELNLFTADSFNIYGGISQPSYLIPANNQRDMVVTAHALDSQVMLEAKYQQIGLGGGELRSLVDEYVSHFNPVPTSELAQLREKLTEHMDAARVKQVSRIGVYSEKTWLDAQLHRQYGQRNEWESMYQPITQVYDADATDIKLLAAYQQSLEAKDVKALEKAKNDIYHKITIYNLDKDIASRAKNAIFSGNENFKIMINHLVSNQYKQDWSGTFRIGGDELGKIVWDAKNAYLSIYRFDINNLGKINFQWGMRIGDKLIDEILRLVDQINQDGQYMRDIYKFFNNQPNQTGKIFSDLRWQLDDADYMFISSELRHQGKNIDDYISVEADKYFLKKIPEVNVPLRDLKTGELFELYKGLEGLKDITSYESGPAVSAGVIKNIPAAEIRDQLGKNMVDISGVQGRADRAAEKAKEDIKEGQAKNNGGITEEVFAKTDIVMVAAGFNPKQSLRSFEKYEATLLDQELAEYMLLSYDRQPITTVSASDYSDGIIQPISESLNLDDSFQFQQSI